MKHIYKVNRSYKDRLFRFIFNDKKELLNLYNAINETTYDNPEDLEINTMDNVIYMGMKNDLSFLIYGILNLYEHQSTWNPNMPIRNLIYIVDLYKGYIQQNGLDLYGSRRILLPTPQAIVFYNGVQDQPERSVLKLSQSYEAQGKESCLEFSTIMLNVNYGKNQELMKRCQTLMEYAAFIEMIRNNMELGMRVYQAVDMAITKCVQDGILTEILTKHKSEVTQMILEEYDEQAHIENEKRWSAEKGEERMALLIRHLIGEGRLDDIEKASEDIEYRKKLFKEYEVD